MRLSEHVLSHAQYKENANFLISQPNHMMSHSLESSRRDDFNEGLIIGFGSEIKKLS